MPKPGTFLSYRDDAYDKYDPYGNYAIGDLGVILNPEHMVGMKVRTSDGKWANCHPPNGVNLHAYGVRWWVDKDEWAALDAKVLRKTAKTEPDYAFEIKGSLFDKWGEWIGGPCPSVDTLIAAEEHSDELLVKGWKTEDADPYWWLDV